MTTLSKGDQIAIDYQSWLRKRPGMERRVVTYEGGGWLRIYQPRSTLGTLKIRTTKALRRMAEEPSK